MSIVKFCEAVRLLNLGSRSLIGRGPKLRKQKGTTRTIEAAQCFWSWLVPNLREVCMG
jgi:hypothetical protein